MQRHMASKSSTSVLGNQIGNSKLPKTKYRRSSYLNASSCTSPLQPNELYAQNRRNALLSLGTILLSSAACESKAADEVTTLAETLPSFSDPVDNFTLAVPSGWASGEGALTGNSSYMGASGARRTLAWFPDGENARDTNITVVVTNVSAEFTKLGSFGTPLAFGTNLVNSMDRSFLLRAPSWAAKGQEIQIAKLLDARQERNTYFVEYTVEKVPEPKRHLISRVALGYNGNYNRLYTVTAQCLEQDLDKYGQMLNDVVSSFAPPPWTRA